MDITDPHRHCPECGSPFTATNGRAVFCSPQHQRRFHKLMEIRGRVALPFLLTWRGSKHGNSDASRYAFAQLCSLADKWRTEDAAVGRDAKPIVTAKMDAKWIAADLG